MTRNEIPSIDIEHFLASHFDEWRLDGFFVTNDIYPFLPKHAGRIEFYAIGLCQTGLYRTEINLDEYSITPDCFMALKPHCLVNLREIRDYSGMLLIFDKDFFLRNPSDQKLLESLQFFTDQATPVVPLKPTDAQIILHEFNHLRRRAAQKDHPYRKEIARNLLINLLYEADVLYRRQQSSVHQQKNVTTTSAASHQQPNHKATIAMRFQELLTIHIRQQHEVQFYANALFISPKYLSEVLRENLGKNASELIADKLATEAKLLLKSTSLGIAQIATLLNFADTASFTHFFRKHSDLSPISFRKA